MKRKQEQLVRDVLRVRLSQILINEKYKDGIFKIPIHLAMGHEAIAVALNSILRKNDKLVLSHRNIAYNIARLGKLRPILDEYLLKSTGLAGGKLGSMNLINPSRGIVYTSSILGNNFPVAAGIAMAEKVRDKNNITIVVGGDGSMEEGSFYESLTIMSILGLNVIIIIENNNWSLATQIKERRCHIDLEKFSTSLGIQYIKLEGNEVIDYKNQMESIRGNVIKNEKPVCVEVKVTTLGDWRGEDGHFINYHAGATPSVDINKHVNGILKNNAEDPLFIASQRIGKEKFNSLLHEIKKELENELI